MFHSCSRRIAFTLQTHSKGSTQQLSSQLKLNKVILILQMHFQLHGHHGFILLAICAIRIDIFLKRKRLAQTLPSSLDVDRTALFSVLLAFGQHICANMLNTTVLGWTTRSTVCLHFTKNWVLSRGALCSIFRVFYDSNGPSDLLALMHSKWPLQHYSIDEVRSHWAVANAATCFMQIKKSEVMSTTLPNFYSR